jgi:hypothetical protein
MANGGVDQPDPSRQSWISGRTLNLYKLALWLWACIPIAVVVLALVFLNYADLNKGLMRFRDWRIWAGISILWVIACNYAIFGPKMPRRARAMRGMARLTAVGILITVTVGAAGLFMGSMALSRHPEDWPYIWVLRQPAMDLRPQEGDTGLTGHVFVLDVSKSYMESRKDASYRQAVDIIRRIADPSTQTSAPFEPLGHNHDGVILYGMGRSTIPFPDCDCTFTGTRSGNALGRPKFMTMLNNLSDETIAEIQEDAGSDSTNVVEGLIQVIDGLLADAYDHINIVVFSDLWHDMKKKTPDGEARYRDEERIWELVKKIEADDRLTITACLPCTSLEEREKEKGIDLLEYLDGHLDRPKIRTILMGEFNNLYEYYKAGYLAMRLCKPEKPPVPLFLGYRLSSKLEGMPATLRLPEGYEAGALFACMHSQTPSCEDVCVRLHGGGRRIDLKPTSAGGYPDRWRRGPEAREITVRVKNFDQERPVRAELWLAFPKLKKVFMIPLVVAPVPSAAGKAVMLSLIIGMLALLPLAAWMIFVGKDLQFATKDRRSKDRKKFRERADYVFKELGRHNSWRMDKLKDIEVEHNLSRTDWDVPADELLRTIIRVIPKDRSDDLIERIRKDFIAHSAQTKP